MVSNGLSYNSMLTILQDAAVGGMTCEFSTLQTLASMLNLRPGGITTSAMSGHRQERHFRRRRQRPTWTGGASTSVARQSQRDVVWAQATELIGKWFLGTDLRASTSRRSAKPTSATASKVTTNALYGASETPSYLDVNQGSDGDCCIASAIAEVALMDPTTSSR